MYKIAIIGDSESVMCYRAVGFDVFVENTHQSAARLLKELAQKDYAVIFIIEDLYEKMRSAVDAYAQGAVPAVLPLPGRKGSDGSGMTAISRAVERAIGADIAN